MAVKVPALDPGLILTGLFAALVGWRGKHVAFRGMLPIAWCVCALAGMTLPMSWVVAVFAIVDLFIAGVCLIFWTLEGNQRARVIGGLSMALMPVHFVFSALHGRFDWIVYASILNTAFVLQCLTATGGLDGVGRWLGRLLGGLVPGRLRARGRG